MNKGMDEWQLFFDALGDLLNKHHFMIGDFTLGRAIDDRIMIFSFNSDGKKVFPVYSVPKELKPPFIAD